MCLVRELLLRAHEATGVNIRELSGGLNETVTAKRAKLSGAVDERDQLHFE